MIRRNAEDLADWLDRANQVYRNFGAVMTGKPAVFEFPSGAIIRTGHLKDDQAYTKYMGHEYHRMVIEELTQIPNERSYLQLLASCRSTVPGLIPQVFLTANPGGVGHGWVKKRFIDPSPPYKPFPDPTSGRLRIYIPSTVEDNPVLSQADPGYVAFLDALKNTDEELWKAWRHGDWDAMAGQFFRSFDRRVHVVPSFVPRPELPKFAGMDWGYTAPHAIYAAALQQVSLEDGRRFNRLWVYKELTDTEKTPKEVSVRMKQQLPLSQFEGLYADPAIWGKSQDRGSTIADQFYKEGIRWKKADNDRINGWAAVRQWLSIAPDGLPYVLISEDCVKLIETLPSATHDETKKEDIDKDFEDDHSLDAFRYLCKSVKFTDPGVKTINGSRRTNRVREFAQMVGDEQVSLDLAKLEKAYDRMYRSRRNRRGYTP